jgi:hypothetical protein
MAEPGSELQRQLEAVALAYSENTVLRAVVNAIPWIGGSLDVLLSAKGQAIVHDRIMTFLDILHRRMAQVEAVLARQAQLESPQFFDTIVAGFEAAARTPDVDRQEHIAAILAGSVAGPWNASLEPRQAIAILRDLTPGQLQLARTIYATQSGSPTDKQNELQWALSVGWQTIRTTLGLSLSDFQTGCIMLQRAGLIREIAGAYVDYTGGVYVITPVFRALMDYVHSGGLTEP